LAGISKTDDSQYSSLIRSVLQSRDCLGQIEKMNSKVIRLSGEWKKHRTETDSQKWDEISRLADDALQQAVRLNELCSATARKLQSAKDGLAKELAELGKGARYLKCAKPAKNNYPKFIDSMG